MFEISLDIKYLFFTTNLKNPKSEFAFDYNKKTIWKLPNRLAFQYKSQRRIIV